jgi:hypothetical protein
MSENLHLITRMKWADNLCINIRFNKSNALPNNYIYGK